MRVLLVLLGSLAVASCSLMPATTRPAATTSPTATPSGSPSPVAGAIPLCDDMAPITAPPERYRDSPIYVGNEMPSDELRAWASTKPGFEALWIDRDHHGWVTLAFSEDAEERQAELENEFPGVGAVVVGVDWTMAELEALEREVTDRLTPGIAQGVGSSESIGRVTIYIGVLSEERLGAVAQHFAGEPVCVEGADPANVPSDGPQAQAGRGWRLLGDGDGVGPAYRTGIAWDESSYAELWRTTELPTQRPAVDFESEIAIWFGVVTGSLCPPIRMDDVLVDPDRRLVYPEIVYIGFGACTDDIHPHAYVVAFDRDALPEPPFTIGLDAEGRLGDRTVVEADLSLAGSQPRQGEVRIDSSRPEYVPGPGVIVETGYEFEYRQSAHCGLEWLGPINDVHWQTAEADGPGWIPDRWTAAVEGGEITLSAIIREGNPPRLHATAAGHTVMYEATAQEAPGCD